ncbi:uncharacterized protein Z518_10377 [Rhinocladiella mackenziei CBS 650.93]|uniref:Uncharacterized protein n=1 Tax=Rhinocladiella mackenziei CBS 650.93 TaxID=1442369 RepID=A0A0D2GPE9_9EURO|nr:uncharacterized protein Z518_10377 [Rhinocladiella mackenziei CBS 650.93]KIX00238.1 hypothetical protein Z518_10377 [Rhinocladiella mackenziei CBS 650.93]
MAQGAQDVGQLGQGSLHILQLFDSSYTVLSVDQTITEHLKSVESAKEKLDSAKAMLSGLGPRNSPTEKIHMQQLIRNAEYCARILAQDLHPARGDPLSFQAAGSTSRPFLILGSDQPAISTHLQELSSACSSLERLIEACKSSPAPTSLDESKSDLPDYDPSMLLHYRRVSRIRYRRVNSLPDVDQSKSEPRESLEQSPNVITSSSESSLGRHELPARPTSTSPAQGNFRGPVWSPSLTSMPELEGDPVPIAARDNDDCAVIPSRDIDENAREFPLRPVKSSSHPDSPYLHPTPPRTCPYPLGTQDGDARFLEPASTSNMLQRRGYTTALPQDSQMHSDRCRGDTDVSSSRDNSGLFKGLSLQKTTASSLTSLGTSRADNDSASTVSGVLTHSTSRSSQQSDRIRHRTSFTSTSRQNSDQAVRNQQNLAVASSGGAIGVPSKDTMQLPLGSPVRADQILHLRGDGGALSKRPFILSSESIEPPSTRHYPPQFGHNSNAEQFHQTITSRRQLEQSQRGSTSTSPDTHLHSHSKSFHIIAPDIIELPSGTSTEPQSFTLRQELQHQHQQPLRTNSNSGIDVRIPAQIEDSPVITESSSGSSRAPSTPRPARKRSSWLFRQVEKAGL